MTDDPEYTTRMGTPVSVDREAFDRVDLGLHALTPEEKLGRTITNIHSLACRLLNVEGDNRKRVFVGVSPHSATTWSATVRYEGFGFSTTRSTINEALDAVLKDLVDRVTHRLEEDAKLLDEVRPCPR